MADLFLQGLLELAGLPGEWLWGRIRAAARGRGRAARAFIYAVGGTAIVLTYLAAVAVGVVVFYVVAEVVV